MAGRTSFGRISEADYSDLLLALSATAKGRSFLEEYRFRSRPEETGSLLGALQRIESTIAVVRDEVQPERIAEELRRIAMTLEIAADGAAADPDGDEPARRMALIARARTEIEMLADGLSGQRTPAPAPDAASQADGADPAAER